jgi:hypothetical protein
MAQKCDLVNLQPLISAIPIGCAWLAMWLRRSGWGHRPPKLGFGCDRRLLTGPRAIIERFQGTIGYSPLDTALNRLMMHTQGPTHCEEGRIFQVASSIRARSTPLADSVRDRAIDLSFAKSSSSIAISFTRRHAVMTFDLVLRITNEATAAVTMIRPNDHFHGIDGLERSAGNRKFGPCFFGASMSRCVKMGEGLRTGSSVI